MLHGKVIGTATATVKHPSFTGRKLLVVQAYAADGTTPDGDPLLAFDCCGAGMGQQVIVSSDGKYTRAVLADEKTPGRWSVLAISDKQD